LDCGIDILIVHYAAYKLQAKKTEKKHTKPVFQNEFIQIRLEFVFELYFRGIRSKVLKSSGNFVFNRFFISCRSLFKGINKACSSRHVPKGVFSTNDKL